MGLGPRSARVLAPCAAGQVRVLPASLSPCSSGEGHAPRQHELDFCTGESETTQTGRPLLRPNRLAFKLALVARGELPHEEPVPGGEEDGASGHEDNVGEKRVSHIVIDGMERIPHIFIDGAHLPNGGRGCGKVTLGTWLGNARTVCHACQG